MKKSERKNRATGKGWKGCRVQVSLVGDKSCSNVDVDISGNGTKYTGSGKINKKVKITVTEAGDYTVIGVSAACEKRGSTSVTIEEGQKKASVTVTLSQPQIAQEVQDEDEQDEQDEQDEPKKSKSKSKSKKQDKKKHNKYNPPQPNIVSPWELAQCKTYPKRIGEKHSKRPAKSPSSPR